MKHNDRYMTVEAPDTKATVDFLTAGVAVEIEVADGKIRVAVKANHGEESSTWDEHEMEWDLPERDETREDEEES